MRYTPKQYAQALYEALHDTKDADHDKILDNFANLLAKAGDLGKFSEIEEAFVEHEKTVKGIKTAEVTAARKLSDSEQDNLVHELNDYLGSKVELKHKIDKGIIGGVIIKVDDTLLDASVKTHLNNLNQSLKS